MAVKQKKRRWPDDEKRSICFQTTAAGVSVAQVARRYAMNANLIIALDEAEWERFLLDYSGDVSGIVAAKSEEVDSRTREWKGEKPASAVDASGAFLAKGADPAGTPLAILEAEIERFETLVAADKETARKLAAVSKRTAEETNAFASLKEKLADCEGAQDRARTLVADRESGYIRVFDALLAEERVLNELYAPLVRRLTTAGGTLRKLSFSVTRVADVGKWAKRGEDELFDLRGGPFKGIGSLEKEANLVLRDAWRMGDSAAVSAAMTRFRDKHQEALLERLPTHVPIVRTIDRGRGVSLNGYIAQVTYP